MLVDRMSAYFPRRLPYRFFNTTQKQLGISLIVFIFILSTSFVLLIYPQRQDLAQLELNKAVLDNNIRTKKNTAIQQQKLLKLQQHLQQVLRDFYRAEPEYLVTTQLITQIELWSKQQDIQLKKVIWGKLEQEEYFSLQSVKLNFTGSYFQLISLFQYLGESYALLDIVEFTMQKGTGQINSQVSLELLVHIVILKTNKRARTV